MSSEDDTVNKAVQNISTAEKANNSVESISRSKESYQITEQKTALSRSKIITIFLACGTVDFVALIDQNCLAVALPIIGADLGAGSYASWVAVAYFITSTSCQLLYGRLSDIWSRKTILLIGLAIFFFSSLGASLATDIFGLMVFRAIAGVGGGGLTTVAQIIVGDVVSLRERGRWQGILGAINAISNGIGPLIGGAISSKSRDSWRWIFRLNLFTIIISTAMADFFMPLKKVNGHWKAKLRAVDFFGALLTFLGSATTILGLTMGGVTFPWLSLPVALSLASGGILSLAFLLWEWKGARLPLIPFGIFKPHIVKGAILITFTTGWNHFVMVYFLPTFYQMAYGYTPVRAATMLLPVIATQSLSSTLSGLIVTWRGRYRESIIIGYAIWALGLGLHCSLTPSSSIFQQVVYAVISGIGSGQTFQPSLIALQSGVEQKHISIVTGVRSYVRDMGGTFGLAISGSIVNISLRKIINYSLKNGQIDLTNGQIEEILKDPTSVLSFNDITLGKDVSFLKSIVLSAYFIAFRRVFYVGTALGIIAVLISIFLIPQKELGDKGLWKTESKKEAEKNDSPCTV